MTMRHGIPNRPAGPRAKAWVDLLGSLLLLLPSLAVLLLFSLDYVAAAWSRLEGSREAGGLPGLFLLKTVIPAFCLLLGLQGLALAGRSWLRLAGQAPDPGGGDQPEAF